MNFNEIFTAKAVAYRQTQDAQVGTPFLGEAFFPSRNKMGIDLKWIKTHKNVGVALKPSTYDAMATIRPRDGFVTLAEEMPLFRESMKVSEMDLVQITRAQESSDPYVQEVINHLYDDTANLVEGAHISRERMRMSLLAPINGNVQITIGIADNTIYNYNYDDGGEWKAVNYNELLTNKWDAPTSSQPLNDFDVAVNRLAAIGSVGRYAVMNTATLNALTQSAQIKNAVITSSGVAMAYVDKETVKEIIQRKTGLQVVVYDKTFRDYDGTTKKFFPDGYVSVVGEDVLGYTWAGMTPEARSLMGDAKIDVAVLDSGIAIATQTTYGAPVQHSVTASQVCLPSFEGMDSVYVMKVF